MGGLDNGITRATVCSLTLLRAVKTSVLPPELMKKLGSTVTT